jgi:plasmid stability protein
VRQLITRIDDDLHRRLKDRARDEGRSMNTVVTEILECAVPNETPRERLRRRLKAEGRLVEIPVSKSPRLTRDQVRKLLRGDAAKAVLEALDEDRKR